MRDGLPLPVRHVGAALGRMDRSHLLGAGVAVLGTFLAAAAIRNKQLSHALRDKDRDMAQLVTKVRSPLPSPAGCACWGCAPMLSRGWHCQLHPCSIPGAPVTLLCCRVLWQNWSRPCVTEHPSTSLAASRQPAHPVPDATLLVHPYDRSCPEGCGPALAVLSVTLPGDAGVQPSAHDAVFPQHPHRASHVFLMLLLLCGRSGHRRVICDGFETVASFMLHVWLCGYAYVPVLVLPL